MAEPLTSPVEGEIELFRGYAAGAVKTFTFSLGTDITGWTFSFTIQDYAGRVWIQKGDAAFVRTLPTTLGLVSLTFLQSDTSPLPEGQLRYTLWRTDLAGGPVPLRTGLCMARLVPGP